jgi:hypothetical protein
VRVGGEGAQKREGEQLGTAHDGSLLETRLGRNAQLFEVPRGAESWDRVKGGSTAFGTFRPATAARKPNRRARMNGAARRPRAARMRFAR